MTVSNRLQTAVPIGLMVVLAVVVMNVFPFRHVFAQESTVDLARERLVELETQNVNLEQEIAALSTETELERLARRDLGYVREGEIAYVITAPDDNEVAPDPVRELPQSRPWWKVVTDFLTGEDLVSR